MSALKAIREERGLTQVQIGEIVGFKNSTVSLHETHESRLTLPIMRRYAESLSCTVGEIAGESPISEVPQGTDSDAAFWEAVSGMGDISATVDDFSVLGSLFNLAAGRLKVWRNQGDAMANAILDGDNLLIGAVAKNPDGLHLIRDGTGYIIRRIVTTNGGDNPTLRLIADNPLYPDVDRRASELVIEGRVVGRFQRL